MHDYIPEYSRSKVIIEEWMESPLKKPKRYQKLQAGTDYLRFKNHIIGYAKRTDKKDEFFLNTIGMENKGIKAFTTRAMLLQNIIEEELQKKPNNKVFYEIDLDFLIQEGIYPTDITVIKYNSKNNEMIFKAETKTKNEMKEFRIYYKTIRNKQKAILERRIT